MDTRRQPRRIALLIQYDGTDFQGSQIQPDCRTVQDEIEKSLNRILNEEIRIIFSGRTDAGVHALMQVAHFDTNSEISLNKLVIGANAVLDQDISILNAYHVNNDFHSRFDAIERIYEYVIYNSKTRSPFYHKNSLWIRRDIDTDLLYKTLKMFEGEHDFASFCKKTSTDCNTIRTINYIRVVCDIPIIKIEISGNAFLHNMIRIMVGTALDIAFNNMSPDIIKDLISQKDRSYSGITISSRGLYLKEIKYKPELKSYNSAF